MRWSKRIAEPEVRRLLHAFSEPGTLYVLGAGASFGLVPTTAQLRDRIKNRNWSVGSFPVTPAPRTPMFDRVIGCVGGTPSDAALVREDPHSQSNLAEAFLAHVRPAVLDTLVRMELVVPIAPITPPQYAVFDAAARGTIITFNLDGLAPAYCDDRHRVLEPHGRVERELFESREFAASWRELASLDLGVPHWTQKVLLEPERQELLGKPVYRLAETLIQQASSVVFIGYSFSKFGGTRDDDASLEFFSDCLRRRAKRVLVVDPAPEEVAELLSLGARRPIVATLPAKWELLSFVIASMVHDAGYQRIHHRSAKAETVVARYHALSQASA